MKAYSQKNPRWSSQKLGTCNTTIKSSGCFISSLCMIYDGLIETPKGKMAECHPGILDWIATEKKLYANGCNVVQDKFCKYLNLKNDGRTTAKPKYSCIAETNHYAKIGVPQHFFIWNPDGTILDPLDGNVMNLWTPKPKKNPYKIISYRLITK